MFWWWLVYHKFPLRVLALGIIMLVMMLVCTSLPFLFNDIQNYPLQIVGHYEGAALFFPFIMSYLIIGVPHLMFEQRRQMKRLVRHMGLSSRAARIYVRAVTKLKPGHSITAFVLGALITPAYLGYIDHLYIDDLTLAQELRRSALWIIPVFMWAFYIESIYIMTRAGWIIWRMTKWHFRHKELNANAFQPMVKIFSNNTLFSVFTMMSLPILWFESQAMVFEIIFGVCLVVIMSFFLSLPIAFLWFSALKGRVILSQTLITMPKLSSNFDLPFEISRPWYEGEMTFGTVSESAGEAGLTLGAGRILPPEVRVPNVKLSLLERMLALASLVSTRSSNRKPSQVLVLLYVQFWLVMLLPLVIWGLAFAAHDLLNGVVL